jgi:hypothetical protein
MFSLLALVADEATPKTTSPHPLTNSAAGFNAITPARFNEREDTSDSFQDPFPPEGGRHSRHDS